MAASVAALPSAVGKVPTITHSSGADQDNRRARALSVVLVVEVADQNVVFDELAGGDRRDGDAVWIYVAVS